VVLRVWVDTEISVVWGQKCVTSRRSKPVLCIFNVTTACLSIFSVGTWEKSSLLTLKSTLATSSTSKNHPVIIFFICCFRPVTRGEKPPTKLFAPLEKCVGHNLKTFDIVQKFWAPLGKLFAPPGVPNWLRACVVWSLGREMLTKLRFGLHSKKFGNRWSSHSGVSGWSLF